MKRGIEQRVGVPANELAELTKTAKQLVGQSDAIFLQNSAGDRVKISQKKRLLGKDIRIERVKGQSVPHANRSHTWINPFDVFDIERRFGRERLKQTTGYYTNGERIFTPNYQTEIEGYNAFLKSLLWAEPRDQYFRTEEQARDDAKKAEFFRGRASELLALGQDEQEPKGNPNAPQKVSFQDKFPPNNTVTIIRVPNRYDMIRLSTNCQPFSPGALLEDFDVFVIPSEGNPDQRIHAHQSQDLVDATSRTPNPDNHHIAHRTETDALALRLAELTLSNLWKPKKKEATIS